MYQSQKILFFVIILVIIVFIIGMIGYKYILNQSWLNSFYFAALTMSSLSLEIKPETNDQKIFVALFTLTSVGLYLILVATIIACFLEPFWRQSLIKS